MSLDVLMLTNNDWANIGYGFAKCLRLLGLDVRFIKGQTHPSYLLQGEIHKMIPLGSLGNPELSPYVTANGLRPLTEEAHVIHFTSSAFVETGTDLRKKHVVVQHDGGLYRQKYQIANGLFKGFADITIIQGPDLLGLGAKNEVWICNPVDTEMLRPDFGSNGKIRIGHFPSNSITKNTGEVLRAIEILEGDRIWGNKFQYIGVRGPEQRVSWMTNLERMKYCDILIERCNSKVMEWGATALEASALGTIVVTNSHSRELYEKEYGKWALHIANDYEQCVEILKGLISLGDRGILEEKHKSREWVVRYHSFEAVARRLWDKVYNERFYKLEKGRLIRC